MIWSLIVSFGVALVTGPWVRGLAIRLDFFDRPDAGLKPHAKPIPYLGGLSIFAGWLTGMVAAFFTGWISLRAFGATAMTLTVLMLLGLIDDIRHLPPKLRLLVQLASPAFVVLAGIVNDVPAALFGESFDLGRLGAVLLTLGFAAVLFAAASNATNLIDGLDGLCAGVLGISAAGFAVFFFAVMGGMANVPGTTTVLGACVALAVVGACAAFLFFNFNPASMFMGDSGSLTLGGAAGLLILLATAVASWHGLIAGILIFGFPVYDTALAVTRRRLNRKPLFIGDRSHFYDQLRDRGLTVRQTVLRCYALAAALAIVGNLVWLIPGRWIAVPALLIPAAAVLMSIRLGLLRVDDAAARSAT